MDRESLQYQFPETLNQQKRLAGLPTEEAVLIIACGVIGFFCDMFIVMLIVAGALWLLVRHLKKGQGTWWLMNLLYWYLPTALLRLQFRRVPDSGNRHWMQ
ncbi:conjugal transfer pilus assembly protein TraL [Pantoea sp. AN62]|uniref:type IV conjugative transfer system protein TraL n=1 Tax=Pantoea TaxID=53335 RepID=UPI00083D2E5C|nr:MULTISPECIES: type IV conjugative transfer system protein TraL [Pantoea]MDU4747858.1 type IV conjugative transfer system protein TraL [Pantoea sp.]HCR0227230.1 type IV conjugative transfer system protein TraL [Enterobacter kobei]AOE42642.1 type IV conjugative transfer system protein TraL [Pantoea agglomerans]OXM21217.1 type IV conjugative transfer system protein TraL [Pantoea sp. AV62]RAH26678.1 type IV conjugative transfer system protein TraL [Pantoea agglomerans]